MIFFKCLDDMNCGKKMTYLVDGKGCNLCGAPCEILHHPELSVKAPDSEDPIALRLRRAENKMTNNVREEDDGYKGIAQRMDGLSLEMATEKAGVEGSSSNDPHSALQDISQGWNILRVDVPSPVVSRELSQRPLTWMPDGVFGNIGVQQDFSPELDLVNKPSWPSTYVRTTGPDQIDISIAVEGSKLSTHVDGAPQRPTRTGETALAFPHDGEHYRADTNVVRSNFAVPKELSDDENEIHELASEAVPCQVETTACLQNPELPRSSVAEKLEEDEKNEKKRKAKAKKKARKERKQAEAAAEEQAPKKPAAPKFQLNTSSAPIAMLEKPEPVVPKSPT